MNISQKTWKYLHGPDDTTHLSFATGGVPRSFSVIQYTATERYEIDLADDGIAIIDNDNLGIVLDGHLKGQVLDQLTFMSDVRAMDWAQFSAFCMNHGRYRGRQTDFGSEIPDKGVLSNQVQRGVLIMPADSADLRSPSMVAANGDPGCPYTFPVANRARMISDLMNHVTLQDEDGTWRLAWDMNLDTGVAAAGISDDEAPESDEDETWRLHYEGNPEIFHHVAGRLMEPYFTGDVGSWPKSDRGRYGFVAGGIDNATILCLDTIDGTDIGVSSRGEFGRFLDALPDVAIRDIWKIVRVVDHDLSASVMEQQFKTTLEEYRGEFERARRADRAIQPTVH